MYKLLRNPCTTGRVVLLTCVAAAVAAALHAGLCGVHLGQCIPFSSSVKECIKAQMP